MEMNITCMRDLQFNVRVYNVKIYYYFFVLILHRPTMIKYGLNNIRDLVGSKVDMEMVHNNPLCRLEK